MNINMKLKNHQKNSISRILLKLNKMNLLKYLQTHLRSSSHTIKNRPKELITNLLKAFICNLLRQLKSNTQNNRFHKNKPIPLITMTPLLKKTKTRKRQKWCPLVYKILLDLSIEWNSQVTVRKNHNRMISWLVLIQKYRMSLKNTPICPNLSHLDKPTWETTSRLIIYRWQGRSPWSLH